MPQISNAQTIQASTALAALVKVKRPMLGALKMRQLARAMVPHLEDYEAERQKLLDTFAAREEDGRRRLIGEEVQFADDAAKAAFAKEFAELLLATWECPLTLTVKDFGGLDVEAEYLIALGDLLEDPAPEKAAPALVKD